ncbi:MULTISPECIES: hypothetical protein [unclassified Pseudoalteromonas]|uniref:hypothetical protein n=1 Tax=unclassified Pseudoalteromonas TaxID=194690 RepID=UPI000C069A84|nr:MULTISPECIES: hypothetical protein [unclassified Pseudoalteromonas]MDP2636497.1 hypothetical protein [Pseudoalteromonas sp. 1_MG-2023]PHN88346.1 hypothetical protein CSC79_18310 [Pseudoalteromonas sp. 3D05]
MDNTIKHALFLTGWAFDTGNKNLLKGNAQRVLVSEYSKEMEGNIFCPECSANLYRSPKDKEFSDNGKAFFAHSRGIETDCGLRSKKPKGKKYDTEEEAWKAIQDEELVIISSFIKDEPLAPAINPRPFNAEHIEDIDGPPANVPIVRHRGEDFTLPSKFKSVRGLVRSFNDNFYRYFHLPGKNHAIKLKDLLVNVETIVEPDDQPKLYYGRIKQSYLAGPNDTNIRMTELKFSKTAEYKDFYFKASGTRQGQKGITNDSNDRVIIIYGKVTESGIGLSIENVGWGEFALLPQKYENYIYN